MRSVREQRVWGNQTSKIREMAALVSHSKDFRFSSQRDAEPWEDFRKQEKIRSVCIFKGCVWLLVRLTLKGEHKQSREVGMV